MKKSLILILTFLLLLAACAPTGAASEPAVPEVTAVPTVKPAATDAPVEAVTGLMQVYENKDAGFSLRLPTNWTVSEAQVSTFQTLYLVGPEPAQVGPANSSIIVADADQMTAVQLAEQLQCGGSCNAPVLTDVKLRNGITTQFALIGGGGSPLLPWYFVEHDGKLVALSFHDPVNTEQSLDAIVQSLVFGPIFESGGEEMAPLQAARQMLAESLGVNPYALVMESITSIDWPDSCLGVYVPEAMCAQVVTPGYAVTLSLREQLYQANSNADGSLVVRVPVSGAPGGGLSLTWQDGGGCYLALVQPGSGVKSGPCDGSLTAYAFSSDTSEAVAQLDTMMAKMAPFYSETAVGLLNVNGFGTEFANAAQMRQMAEMARWLTETAVAGRTSAADHLAFSWHREGGMAGYCDDLAVYSTGLSQATSCKGTNTSIMLTEEQLAQLYDWRDTLQGFDFEQADPAGVADGMRIAVMFKGNGRAQPTAAQKQAVLALADAIYAEATTTTQANADASATVNAFLTALQADPSGTTSLIYLSSALQAEVAAGRTVQSIVGVQNAIPTFTTTVTDDGQATGQAVVAATLNYSSLYDLSFSLIQENGQWRINGVTSGAAAYQPIAKETCAALADAITKALGASAEASMAAFTDYVSGLNGLGCQITLTGTGETFGTFLQVAAQMDALLTDQGWTQDTAYLADGPTGTAAAFRLGDQLALFNVDWQPSADANCPTDEPITACDLAPARQIFTITLNLAETVSG